MFFPYSIIVVKKRQECALYGKTAIALLIIVLPVAYAAGEESSKKYVGYMHYEREGGCSRTAEFVTWRALLRIEVEGERMRMRLHARCKEILVARDGRGKGTERIEVHKNLTWEGRIGPGEGFRKVEFAAPQGHETEKLSVGRTVYRPRDRTSKKGFNLLCRIGGDELVCRLPGEYGQPDYTWASISVPYYFMKDGKLVLKAEPGEVRRRFQYNLVKGVLPGGKKKEKPAKKWPGLISFIEERRRVFEGADEYAARLAGNDLIVIDPGILESYLKHDDTKLRARALETKKWLSLGRN